MIARREMIAENTPQPIVVSRQRYLIVLNEIGFLYSHFRALATAIQLEGWDVIVTTRAGSSPVHTINAGMQFIPIRIKYGVRIPVAEIMAIADMCSVNPSYDPDMVHLVSLKNAPIGGLLIRWRKSTLLFAAITGLGSIFVEGYLMYSALRLFAICGFRNVFKKSRSVMALENRNNRNIFIEKGVVSAEMSFVIPGAGLDSDAIVPLPHRNCVTTILCVCRMIRYKGILILIEAARSLQRAGLRYELLKAGDIDDSNYASLTREELQSAESDGAMKWLGFSNDVPELLNRTDIFCLPSYYREGLPRALVETCAAGCAIVTTDIPGCREVVVDGVNGRLVPPRNVVALTDALRALLCDPEACRRMGIESRRRFEERFTMTSVLAAFNQCYDALDIPLRVSCGQI
jgi:glycosyltransferase involved in cell wall biosynthesis